jgi:hypothetical protein
MTSKNVGYERSYVMMPLMPMVIVKGEEGKRVGRRKLCLTIYMVVDSRPRREEITVAVAEPVAVFSANARLDWD